MCVYLIWSPVVTCDARIYVFFCQGVACVTNCKNSQKLKQQQQKSNLKDAPCSWYAWTTEFAMQFNVKYTQVYIKTYLITTKEEKKCYVWRGRPLAASLSIHFSKQFWFFNEFFCVCLCVAATKANISFCISMPIKWLERHQNIVLLVAFLQLVLHPIEHSAIQKCHRIHFPIWPYALKIF